MARVHSFVACNVYISAARPRHYPILHELLVESIQNCRILRNTQRDLVQQQEQRLEDFATKIALVDVYADVPYNRSSFHFAGHGPAVAQVVSTLASHTMDRLLPYFTLEANHKTPSESTKHPFVGIVDHISILPLSHPTHPIPIDPFITAQTANTIAEILQQKGCVSVYTYGSAHPQNLSLATVRRTMTSFFTSGGLQSPEYTLPTPTTNTTPSPAGVCTIGSPVSFVENVNIRLSSQCTRDMAKTLTKRVRARDGGIPGVEALTLPYSQGRWEVACNLLQPNLGSMTWIQEVCDQWQKENEKKWVESVYRVGTTEKQCQQVLGIEREVDRMLHESKVLDRFQSLVGG